VASSPIGHILYRHFVPGNKTKEAKPLTESRKSIHDNIITHKSTLHKNTAFSRSWRIMYRYGALRLIYRYGALRLIYRYGALRLIYRYGALRLIYRYGALRLIYRYGVPENKTGEA